MFRLQIKTLKNTSTKKIMENRFGINILFKGKQDCVKDKYKSEENVFVNQKEEKNLERLVTNEVNDSKQVYVNISGTEH